MDRIVHAVQTGVEDQFQRIDDHDSGASARRVNPYKK